MYEKQINKAVRQVQTGQGVTGVQMNFSLIHMFSLCALRDRTKQELLEQKNTNAKQQVITLLEHNLQVLDFICRDFTHPDDPSLWEIKAENEL